jgi:DNA end-binding protein Ku
MARSIYTGAVSFGLVTVPVKVYSATSSHRVDFHQLQRGTGERIRQKRVAEGSGEEVEYGDIVKGYEVEDGHWVTIEREELEAVEPGRTRTIEITDFVDLAQIDPIAWNSTYYLGPQEDVGAEKPYELLRQALRSTGKAAIATMVMRGRQYLCTIRPLGDVLALETMWFADEIRSTDEIENKPEGVTVSDRELGMAEQLIESLTGPWEPERYTDTYQEAVMDLIRAKAEGEEVVVREEEEAPAVGDLMEALRRSVEATTRKREAGAEAAKASVGPPEGRSGDGLSELTKDQLIKALSSAA